MGAGAVAAQVTIPSLGVQQGTGTAIRNNFPVNATLLARPGTDNSVQWLLGEDSTGGITGALRDMWNPTCYSNPAKVLDTAFYVCDTSDNGGVHTNSGIPNHAYALLVSGGTYNGQTVNAIGRTKAAQVYFRAQSFHQVQDSDFSDHADALEASCLELIGRSFASIGSDPLNNGPINANDCGQVTSAIMAVQLRTPPQCTFTPLLSTATPATCSTANTTGVTQPIMSFNFAADPSGWSKTHSTPSATFSLPEWTWKGTLPDGRTGGFHAPTPITDCAVHDLSLIHISEPT